MARIAVVGSGAWGTALACHLARLEHAVTMWAYEPEVAEEVATRHTNSPYQPGVGGRAPGGGERRRGHPRAALEPSARRVGAGGPGRAARRDRRGRHQGHRGADAQADVDGPRGDDAWPRARAARLPLRTDLCARGLSGPADRRRGGLQGN